MNQLSIDATDLHILECLKKDARLTHKDIGEIVHLTGQAVGTRIRKMEDMGIIEGYTVKWNSDKIKSTLQAFVTVFTKSTNAHQQLQSFIRQDERVQEAHRVSGEGCYWLRLKVEDHLELNQFLDDLLHYANYKVSLSINKIK